MFWGFSQMIKKLSSILLLLTFFVILSSCGSKASSQQVVMSNIETNTPAPTEALKNTLTAATPSPSPSGKASTPNTTPVITPAKTTATVINITPSPLPSSTPASTTKSSPLVVVDAGHGGNDPGTSGNGLVEKEVTLDIAKRLNQLLTNNGVKTYMIRTGDTYMDHRDRIYLANDMKASLYISIHCDWFENPKYSGTQTFYTTVKELTLGNLTELQYAKYVHNELINSLKSNNRGTTDRPTLAAVKYATMPSILVETGFLSNPAEASNLSTGEYRQKIAEAMSSGIMQSLKKADIK